MNAQRIDIGKSQWIALRDGIVFVRCSNWRRPGELTAVPEGRVRVMYRAMPTSIWTLDVQAFSHIIVLTYVVLALLICAVIVLDSSRALYLSSVVGFSLLLVLCLLGIWKARRLQRAGWRSAGLTAQVGSRALELKFGRIQGANPALETLLENWMEHRPIDGYGLSTGVAMEFRRPFALSFETAFYAFTFLSIGFSELYIEVGSPSLAIACFLGGALVLTPYMLTRLLDALSPRALRTARSALLADELEAARLMLEHFLAEKPRHVYGNLLMAACALMEGDIQLAAKHRQAMRGENSRFRLAEELYALAYRVTSAGAFQAVAEYAAKGAFDTASPQADPESTHEQPAH